MKVTLRQLQVFDAVATHGSVTGAAEHLGMSQSAVSSSLKDLQIVLQRPLFSPHNGSHIRMTDEGRRLKASVRSALVSVEEIERDAHGLLEGRLLIGATELASETLLPSLCVKFQNRYPDIQINIETASAKTLFDKVGQLDLDAAVIEIYAEIRPKMVVANTPEIEIIKWVHDDLSLLVSPDHPLAGRNDLEIADVKNWPWCAREPESTFSHTLQALLYSEHEKVRASFVCNSDKALRLMAIDGGGIVCLSNRLVADDIAAVRLVKLNVRDFRFSRHICLIRPKGMRRPRAASTFDNFLLEQVEPSAHA